MSRLPIPPLLLRAGLRYQLRHRWQALLALSGIVMGVAVVLAVDLANGAARASFDLSAQQLRGAATHRLVGADGQVPQALYTRLFTSAGHPPMAPVISARVRVDGRPGRFRLFGVDIFAEGAFRAQLPAAITAEATLADWLARPDVLALSRSAAVHLATGIGGRLTLRHPASTAELEVVAIGDDDSVGSRDLLIVDIATAQAITGLDGFISHIDLALDGAGQAWLQERLPVGIRLVRIDEQIRGVVAMSASFELNLTAMSLLALLVGVFLIFNAMTFSVVQRRTLFGRLRAIGVDSAELSRLVLAEALVLGAVGTLIGGLLGIWLGRGLTAIVAATVSELYYDVTAGAQHLSWASLIKAGVLGLGGTLFATWIPARRAARTPPLTTLSRAALERSARQQLPWLAGAGGLLLLAGLLVAIRLPGGIVAGFAGLFALVLGAAMVTPLALHLTHRLLGRLPIHGIGRMVARDLDRHLSRLGTATAALMVALAAGVGVAVMVDSMRASVSNWLGDLLTADLYVTAEGFEDGASLPPAVVAQAPGLAPVSAYSSYRSRRLDLASGQLRLIAAHLAPRSRAGFAVLRADGDPWAGFDAGGLLISESLAHRRELAPGDRLRLPTPSGERDFPVAGVFRDYASEHGRMFIARVHYERHWPDRQVDSLALFSDLGADALWSAAGEQLTDADRLVFTAAAGIYAESMAVFDRTFRITEVLRLLALLVAFVGVLSALMAVQLERRKEYAVLRALGLTRSQVSGLILAESTLLGSLAGLLALPVGVAMAWVLTSTIQLHAFGWSMPFLVSPSPLLLTWLLGTTAALLAGLYPAWRSSRYAPAAQLRED